MSKDSRRKRRRLARPRRGAADDESGGFGTAPPDEKTEPNLTPGPEVAGPAAARDKKQVESGGFGPGPGEGESRRVGASHTGPGRSGAPPTAEIEVAQQLLMANLGHEFASMEPLAAALTHPSWRNERSEVTLDNQRIEFLGDLVLGLAVGEILLLRLPTSDEGELSVLKARLVRQSTLAQVARGLGVGLALRLGRGEERNGGRDRPAVLADALEAVFAAVFIDAGYERARDVIARALSLSLEALLDATQQAEVGTAMALHAVTHNYKTALQEWLARADGQAPHYALQCEVGSPQARRFRVSVQTSVAGVMHHATGEARTVKAAENEAAARLFAALTGQQG